MIYHTIFVNSLKIMYNILHGSEYYLKVDICQDKYLLIIKLIKINNNIK